MGGLIGNLVYMSSNRRHIGVWPHGPMDIWAHGHVDTWAYARVDVWACVNLYIKVLIEISLYRRPNRRIVHRGIPTVGIWGTWPYGDVATRVYGHMGISDPLYRRPIEFPLYRRPDRESLYSGPNSGHVDTWAYGHMGI